MRRPLLTNHTPKSFVYRALISSLIFSTAGGVVLHQLDLAERLAAGLLLDLRMHRAQAADIDDELLALAA